MTLASRFIDPKKRLDIFSSVIAGIMFVVFFYGLARFPDNPIRDCGNNQYCGKQGQPHSYDDFKAFNHWTMTMLYLWPSGMFLLFYLQKEKKLLAKS